MQLILLVSTSLVVAGQMVGGATGVGPAWTRGEVEAPAGEKDMGGWTAAIYTKEQQLRLGVNEMGEKQPATGTKERPASRFPVHWGEPPLAQTRDIRPLPGGYGMGSGTLAKWIQTKMDEDAMVEPKGAGATEAAMPSKDRWPELLGTETQVAVATIRKERPDLQVVTVSADSMVTMDYDEHRVRVFVEAGRVVRAPRCG